MSDGAPRPFVDELATRWTLTKLRLVIVEGQSDQRLLQLVQREAHCHKALKDLDVLPIEAIEVPAALLHKHGLAGTGAKQRVVAFSRELESRSESDGFRGVIDRDLDQFVAVDLSSTSVLYTDHGCMDAYLWSIDVLGHLVIQFKGEELIRSAREIQRLFESIGSSCADLCAVRIASAMHPEWKLNIHHSERALGIRQKTLSVDLPRYVEQCRPVKGSLSDAKACVMEIRSKIEAIEPLDILNGHDLLWLLTYVLKTFTTISRRLIHEETVAGSLVAFGITNTELTNRPMFKALADWAEPEIV